jgi:predicted metal-binding membrane protein
MRVLDERRLRTALLAAFVSLSWLMLWAWSRTPDGQHFHHAAMGAALFREGFTSVLFFASGWTLMTIAMMLPTSFPLLTRFYILVNDKEQRSWLLGSCIAGYLLAWAVFGVLAHFGVSQLYPLMAGINFQSGLLMAAGLYQFTPLKQYCLQKCRSPLSFIVEHWHGRNPSAESFWLGAHHGIFCIGCCWSLMLLMFLAVSVHLLWMLVLGSVMAIEKNMPWGNRISTPLGVLLIGAGVALKLAGS